MIIGFHVGGALYTSGMQHCPWKLSLSRICTFIAAWVRVSGMTSDHAVV